MQSSFLMDLRKYERADIVCTVVTEHSNRMNHDVMRNLSAGGFCLETVEIPPLREKCVFEFDLPSGPRLRINGEICWSSLKEGSIFCGVKFSDLGFLTKSRLKRFLKKYLN